MGEGKKHRERQKRKKSSETESESRVQKYTTYGRKIGIDPDDRDISTAFDSETDYDSWDSGEDVNVNEVIGVANSVLYEKDIVVDSNIDPGTPNSVFDSPAPVNKSATKIVIFHLKVVPWM